MTRAEHLEWCKVRAREYLEMGDSLNAVASMMSDLRKHPETNAVADAMGMIAIMTAKEKNLTATKKFIEGFN